MKSARGLLSYSVGCPLPTSSSGISRSLTGTTTHPNFFSEASIWPTAVLLVGSSESCPRSGRRLMTGGIESGITMAVRVRVRVRELECAHRGVNKREPACEYHVGSRWFSLVQ